MKIVAALLRIWVEHIAPRSDFGDDNVFRGERFANLGWIARGTIRRGVAQAAVFFRHLARVIGF